MKHLGIDIGTTTICGAVISEDGRFVDSVTEDNRSFIEHEDAWARLQAPETIIETVLGIVERLIDRYPDIASIGVTGQMHGVLYVDRDGRSVSPLFTWQDARGDLPYREGQSYADYACDVSGYRMASGYGLLTHFYNSVNRLIPQEAVTLCTIGDYAVMRLCGRLSPILHTSNAASIGCFDLKKRDFDHSAAEKLSIPSSFLPTVTSDSTVAGEYRGIPVGIAIGDNQASFIGSGAGEHSILVNVGTGSQVSLISDYVEAGGSVELRPFVGDRYLLVGSSLSGGRAYALLERFFRSVVEMTGAAVDSMYPYMAQAIEGCEGDGLKISTLFDGSRDDPTTRGAIEGIDTHNFTPQAMMLGFLNGIADELHGMYLKMGAPEKELLIGSGNGIRKNPKLAQTFEMCFGLPLTLSPCEEEAACGAAIFGREASTE